MSPMARLAAGLIRGYQLIVAPWVTVTCKYHPTCSAYAIDAVRPRTDPTAAKPAALRLSRERT